MIRPEVCARCGHRNDQHWPRCENYTFCASVVYRCDCEAFVRHANEGASYVRVEP